MLAGKTCIQSTNKETTMKLKKLLKILKIVPLIALAYAGSASALNIHFNPAPGMSPVALAGFEAAAQRWENVLKDDITVNLNINFTALAPNVLGSTGSTRGLIDYQFFRDALIADKTTLTDNQATAHLQTGNCMSVMMNGTNVNPAGVGNAATFVDNDCDANNSRIRMTWANARALGLTAAHDSTIDGNISFSTLFSWDFNPYDGVDATSFDFIGVATHEIGHALGFVSGVDTMDGNRSSNIPDSAFTYIAPADVFRCSADSRAAGADIDWSADKRDKFFSFDHCNSQIARFSTGVTWGDGRQASHWKDNEHLGILDPTAGRGEFLEISMLDLQMYDAIGWNVVPEPSSIALMLLGIAGLAGIRRRK
jgi:hypothetical protein